MLETSLDSARGPSAEHSGTASKILAGLLAGDCLLCGTAAGVVPKLCQGCQTFLSLNTSGFRPSSARSSAIEDIVCPYEYCAEIKYLVHRAKFGGCLAAVATLGTLLADQVKRLETGHPAMLVPVPLHLSRLRERDFNQAAEIAKVVAARLKYVALQPLCRKLRHTVLQSTLPNARERTSNVRGAFEFRDVSRHRIRVWRVLKNKIS